MGTVRGERCERYLGISILELVLRRLREENFQADVAYPGQKYPLITEPVATVHIEKVDRANLTVTVEVNIICPAALGGTTCEMEALRATEILRWSKAVCVQNGCSYDGVSQVYIVPILATFTCITEADDCTMGPGFKVFVGDLQMPYTVSFTAEQESKHLARYEMGENAPVDSSMGPWVWKLTLEELIPAGSLETYQPQNGFKIRLEGTMKTETFYHCRWTSIRREYTKEGLRRIQSGFALLWEVKDNG